MDSATRLLATLLASSVAVIAFALLFGLILHNASALIRNRKRRSQIDAPLTRGKP